MATAVVVSPSKISDNTSSPYKQNSTTTNQRRKHRFTLFIGYGENAGSLLKRIEQLKCRLGINTNIEFLTSLLDYFEEKNSQTVSLESDENTLLISDKTLDVDNPAAPVIICSDIIGQTIDSTPNILEPNTQMNTEINISNNHMDNKEDVELEKDENVQLFTAEKLNSSNPDSAVEEPERKKIILEGKLVEEVYLQDPIGLDFSLLSSHADFKAARLIVEYMEHIKKDGTYYHGFINSTEKLRTFLDEFRKLTRTSFTVRSSRSYIKKRAINAMKALKATSETRDLTVGAMQTLETDFNFQKDLMETSLENDNNEMKLKMNEEFVTAQEIVATVIVTSDNQDEIEINVAHTNQLNHDNQVKEKIHDELELMDDTIVTGPLRWEYILGKPPIPFTGEPFFIIGNTQYQCFYASADVRTQRRKSELDKCSTDDTPKPRLRRSLKRDCKAVMCIKSIVSFPEFTIRETIANVKSKKGCRKLKAAQLEKVRQAIEKGDSIGHPAFWVYVPLPEAHTTHELDFNTGDDGLDETSEHLDEISQILNAAAQYGSHVVQVVQEDGEIVGLKISDVESEITTSDDQQQQQQAVTTSNVPVEIQQQLLCLNAEKCEVMTENSPHES